MKTCSPTHHHSSFPFSSFSLSLTVTANMGSGGADEEWVNAAMTDDAMVVDLLVRLHRAPLEWSVRQRRSKVRKAGRSSPSTPLSLSSSASHDFKLSTSTTSKVSSIYQNQNISASSLHFLFLKLTKLPSPPACPESHTTLPSS